jgi:catalase
LSSKGGKLSDKSEAVKINQTYLTTASVVYDSIIVVNGKDSVDKQLENGDSLHFLNEAYKHCKPIALIGDALELLGKTPMSELPFKRTGGDHPGIQEINGVVFSEELDQDFWNIYFDIVAQHRHWARQLKERVPA